MKKIKFGCLYGLAVLFLVSCHSSPSPQNKLRSDSVQIERLNLENHFSESKAAITHMIWPKLVPMKRVLQHTSLVGTPKHPTLDGGIINAADGLPVYSVTLNTPSSPLKIPTPAPRFKSLDIQPKSPLREDQWVTSKEVQARLKEALRDHKLEQVLKETDQMGLPASLATVPMVESHYQMDAVSPKGAIGPWQLTPVVSKSYGLNEMKTASFAAQTQVALLFLDQLHRQFGSWVLALAAYNAGPTRVQHALLSHPDAKSLDELDLPLETQHYVRHLMQLNQALASSNALET